MDDKHREILRSYWDKFRQDLEPEKLYAKLVKVLDATDIQELKSMPTTVEAVDKLFEKLPRKGPEAFGIFVRALEETQPFLATLLKNAELKVELEKERTRSASSRSEAREVREALKEEKEAHKETQKKLRELKSQHEEMMARSKNHKKELEAELEKERMSRTSLESEARKVREAVEEEREAHKETQKKFEEIKSQHEELMVRNEDYAKETEKKEKELKKENNTKQKKIQELEAEKREEVDRLSAKINSLMNEIKNRRDKMEEAKIEHESQLDAKERELAKLKDELKMQESENKRVSEKLKKQNENLNDKKKELEETEKKLEAEAKAKEDALNERAKLREGSARVFHHKKDFDKYGVIYWMGSNFRTVAWEHPSRKSDLAKKVIALRSSEGKGSASDLLEHNKKKKSCTEAKQESWWWVALGKKYLLYLTHYTLRHAGDINKSFLRNWQLEGSLDGSEHSWKVLKKHGSDRKLEKSATHTATWSIEGDVGAFRFFKIVQTGKNSSNDYGIYLSGIELYGVLIEGPNN